MRVSNCCCGMLSLRKGTLLFACLSLAGVVTTVVTKTLRTGVLEILLGACAILGITGVLWNDVKIVLYYLYGILIVSAVTLATIIYLGVQGSQTLKDEVCKSEMTAHQYSKECNVTTIVASWIVGELFWTGWKAVICYGYYKVLEAGGTGDEKKSAQSFAVNQRLNATQQDDSIY
eukprot:GEMP01053372.1.p1 GENE.GEMP01053372.1~~GEMP01053372.1.p1  ORF type:complete len:175 (+),score=40.30 GEMP01053372.1:228-752(+)